MGTTTHILTVLAVDDVARSVAFYRAAFAWPQIVDEAVYAELRMDGGQRLGLYQRAGFAANVNQLPIQAASGELTPVELYLHTSDLQQGVDALARAGGRLLSPVAARPWGDDAAYFADPDGHVVVIAAPSAS